MRREILTLTIAVLILVGIPVQASDNNKMELSTGEVVVPVHIIIGFHEDYVESGESILLVEYYPHIQEAHSMGFQWMFQCNMKEYSDREKLEQNMLDLRMSLTTIHGSNMLNSII